MKMSRKILALVLLLIVSPIVYAGCSMYLASIRGGHIYVVGLAGGMAYSLDGTTWTVLGANLDNVPLGSSIYSKIEITAAGYAGNVIITWILYQDGIAAYTKTDYTTWTLSGNAGDVIFCSPDGTATGQYDWSAQMTDFGDYEIEAEITAV